MNWRSLRIAIVGPLPPPAGGMAGQTQQLAELLRGEGADVEVVQTNAPYRPQWLADLRVLRAIPRLLAYVWQLWRAAGRVQIFHVMANSGWSWHLFAAPAIWIARMRGIRVVVNYRGGEAKPFLERSVRSIRASLNAAGALIVPSAFLEQVFGTFGFRSNVVPNVVDLSRFRPRPRGWTSAERFVAFVPRNLETIYDNATALRAFREVSRELPHGRLVVAGSGPEESRLKALAAELGIADAVEFAGRLDREQMAARYEEATLVLNPTRVDNTPNSMLEALASGVPIVSTNVGGIPFLLSNERTAVLVPAGDPAVMAAAMLRVLREPGLAERLVAAGLADVERYSWNRVRDTLGAVYESLLAPRVASEYLA